MSNQNCLDGMLCPQCGSFEPFRLEVKTIVLMYDDGSDYDKMGDAMDWNDDSYCECLACGHAGVVKDFTDVPTVVCRFCEKETPAKTAHRHRGQWVGDACCWTEGLRASE